MTDEPTPVEKVDKDVIDGARVISREMAKLFTPLSKYPDKMSPMYGIDKVVLDDGRTVFQCVHPDPPECSYWNVNGNSVRSHLRVHVLPIQKEKLKEIEKERDALRLREAQRRANYRAGAKIGAANRKARAAAEAAASQNGSLPTTNGNEDFFAMTEQEYTKKIDSMQTAVEGAAAGLDKVQIVLTNIGKTLNNVIADMEDLANEGGPAVDPAILAKAQSWDAIQGLLNPAKQR